MPDPTPDDHAERDKHAERVVELTRMIDAQRELPRPLGDQQDVRRDAEQLLRDRVVRMIDADHTQRDVAGELHIAPQTLSGWKRRGHERVARGRPPRSVDPLRTTHVIEVLESHGRSLGVPTLKNLFADVPRTTLRSLRDRWCEDHHVEPARLRWLTPGSVWSADFTEPPESIDGFFQHVLIVRDLASHFTLLAAPCDRQCAQDVVFHLNRLFCLHGPPLVFKSDNGSPFIAEQTRRCCRLHRVENLLSPPLTPQYNGSVEATGGTLKTRAAQLAMHNGCDTWSSDILEASRLAANALNRPWGPKNATPDDRWHARAPLTPEQRSALQTLVAHKTLDLTQSIQRERLEKALDQRMTANDRATVARVAIRQALVELGHLHIRRPTPTMSTQSNAGSSEN